jgi:hypothetical protein
MQQIKGEMKKNDNECEEALQMETGGSLSSFYQVTPGIPDHTIKPFARLAKDETIHYV